MVVYNFDVGNYNNLCKTGNHVAGLQKNFFFSFSFMQCIVLIVSKKKYCVIIVWPV